MEENNKLKALNDKLPTTSMVEKKKSSKESTHSHYYLDLGDFLS